MPITINRLNALTRTVTIPIDDAALTVTYRLAAFNTQFNDWMTEHSSDKNSLLGWLERIVQSWDLTDDDKPIPVTVEALERYGIPLPMLRVIQYAVIADASEDNLFRDYKNFEAQVLKQVAAPDVRSA